MIFFYRNATLQNHDTEIFVAENIWAYRVLGLYQSNHCRNSDGTTENERGQYININVINSKDPFNTAPHLYSLCSPASFI